jgi:hypothetical protein
MDSNKSYQLVEQVREVILKDFAGIMKSQQSLISKFILIAVGIEFLGAALDRQHLKATARSEKRFNLAIGTLFPKKYHHFTKPGSVPNLYLDFRCPVIHQFKTEKSIFLCSREDSGLNNLKHLSYHTDGSMILVAEEFYEDLAGAAMEFIRKLQTQ